MISIETNMSYIDKDHVRNELKQHGEILAPLNIELFEIGIDLLGENNGKKISLYVVMAEIEDQDSKILYSADDNAINYLIVNPDKMLETKGYISMDQDLFRMNLSLYTISILISRLGDKYILRYWIYSHTKMQKEED